MTPRPELDPVLAARIDAYLDGAMSPDDLAAFERVLASDPALREELELQRRIDGRLRVLMAPPEALPIPAAALAPGATAGRIGGSLWLKAAAVFALVGIGAWLAIARPWESLFAPPPSSLTADAVVKRLVVDEGFKPIWVCDNDEKFLAYTKEKFHVSFLVRPEPGVQLVGWSYAPGLLEFPADALLVRAQGKDVVVAMGPREQDRTVHVAPGSNLHITRKVYKDVVMYEISPLDHAVVLPAIREP